MSRWLRVCGWCLATLIGLCGVAFARPVAQAQITDRVFLPVLLRDRPVIRGQLLNVQTLASRSNLVLLNVNPVLLSAQTVASEPWISEDAGLHWRQPAVKPWLDEPHLPVFTHVETVLLESAAGPLLVSQMTTIADQHSGLMTVLYASADLGQTWARYPLNIDQGCPALDIRWLGVTPAVPQRLYAQGECSNPDDPLAPKTATMIASDDAGAHWRTISLPSEASTGVLVSPAQADWLYTNAGDSRLWRTSDEGQRWEPAGVAPLGAYSLSPSDPERLVSASALGAFVSKDSGLSWAALKGLPCDLTLGNWELPGPTPLLLFTCTDFRLLLTRDDGQSWETLPPLPWSTIYSLKVFADRAVPERLWLIATGALPDSVWSIDLSTTSTWTRVLDMDPF